MIMIQNLRKDVKTILLNQMAEGKIAPGHRISLSSIAETLEVSATPVREALSQLVETGIVTYIPNRGFFVTELNAKEALELYELITTLESTALIQSTFTNTQLAELKLINANFAKANHATERLKLDMAFHKCLIKSYTNQYAHKLIEDIRLRIFIYEHVYMTHMSSDTSVKMHNDLIDALEKKEVDKAISILQDNWDISIKHINQNHHEQ